MASPWPGYANDPGAGCAEPSAPPQSARGGVGKWTRLAAGREKPRFIISDDVSGKVSLVTDGIFSALHGDSRPRGEEGTSAYFVVLHKVYKGGALNLHGLPLPVVERQDEVKEVGFPQVGGRLLLKVGPGQGDSAAQEETRGIRDTGKERKTGHY